jgi:Fur family transcriptional regulator, ferric uptake regulator
VLSLFCNLSIICQLASNCKFFAICIIIALMDRELDLFKRLLQKNRLFATTARLRLFAALQESGASTIKSLIAKLPRHDQSTVYRNLKLFEGLGVISRLRLGWKSKVELSDAFHHHHHHLTCLKCNKVIVLPEDTVLEGEIARLSYKHRFKSIDHQLEIRGFCQICKDM